MKKSLFIAVMLVFSLGAFAGGVNDKILSIFNKTYPSATEVVWNNIEKGYLAFFTNKAKDISYRIVYDEEGNVLSSIKYYQEEYMPPLIANKVKKSYPDYKITGITEKSSDSSSTEFHITLETDHKMISLLADDIGTLQVEGKYNKN